MNTTPPFLPNDPNAIIKDLQAKLDAIPDLLFEVDLKGKIISFHSPRSDLLYVSPDQFIGKLYAEVLPADAADACMRAVNEANKRGTSNGIQYPLTLPDGLHWFELSVSKKYKNIKSNPEFILLARDITDRNRIQDSLVNSKNQLRSVFEAMAEGVVLQSHDGKIIDANKAAEKILGLTRDQLLGVSSMDPRWQAIYEDGSPFPGEDHPAMMTLRTGKPVSRQVMGISSHDQETRWVSINSILIDQVGSGLARVLTTFVDITDQKNIQLALDRSNRALRVLSDFNETLLRKDDKASLLNAVCRLLVEVGCYEMAWVVLDKNSSIKKIYTATQFGLDEAFLHNGQLRWSDIGRGPDPALRAMNTGNIVINNNCIAQLKISNQASQHKDFRSLIAIPLIYRAETLGALVICAREPNAFNKAEADLLQKLSDNLSYGIETIRVRNEQTEYAIIQESMKNRAIEAESNLVKVSEVTLKRLGQELHDDLGQLLTASMMHAESILYELVKNASREADAAKQLKKLLEQSIKKTRNISHGLYPVEFDKTALISLLEGLVQQMQSSTNKAIRLSRSSSLPMLSTEQSLHLYRIAQEALSNSARHSGADKIYLKLDYKHDRLIMDIVDNGVGLKDREVSHQGIGLLSMRSRAVVIEAHLTVQNVSPSGVRVRVELTC